jgi:adenylate cyclase
MLDGEIDEAIASVEKAVALDPNGADAELNRSIVLTYAGRNAEALTSIERVLQLDPKPRPPVTDYHAFILYMNRRYADALGAMPPSEPEGRGDLGLEVAAMANARLGRDQAAHEAAAEMIRRSPALNLATLRVIYAHHRRAEDLDLRLEALALAGIPQWCYGFAPRQQGRLDAAALRSAVVDRSWVGREHSGAAFEMQFSGDGQFAQSAEGRAIITGSYVLSGDEICTRSEATLMGRAFCSALYRDPGAPGSFIYADSVGIWRFSVQPPIASATRPAPPVASP